MSAGPFQVRRYPAARIPIRGRPSISVRQQTGNWNEWPLLGRLALPGSGEDGRKPAGGNWANAERSHCLTSRRDFLSPDRNRFGYSIEMVDQRKPRNALARLEVVVAILEPKNFDRP